MKNTYTYVEMANVINKPWINRKEVMILLPVGQKQAGKIMDEILSGIDENRRFRTKEKLVPVQRLADAYDIDLELIRREAKKMLAR